MPNTVSPIFDPGWPMAEPIVLGKRSYDYYKNAAKKRLKSVTTIIKNLGWSADGLKFWANEEGLKGRNLKDGLKPEADAGTVAHYFAECYSRKIRPDLTQLPRANDEEVKATDLAVETAQTAFVGFVDWVNRVKPQWVATELKLVSEKHQFGGTIDSFCILEGVPTLVDFKTSKALYADHIIQVSAYKKLMEEHGFQIDQVQILMMNKIDGTFIPHIIQHELLEPAWEAFLELQSLGNKKKILDPYTVRRA